MTASPHILVVEDDREISSLVSRYLRANDCRVSIAASGRDVGTILDTSRINLMVLDLMLPGEDGFSVFKRVRQRSYIPVIILTAKADEIDRIVGLEMGADDYLSKPFNPRELLARIRAVMRRSTMAATAPVHAPARTLTFQGWTVDRVAREVTSPQGVRVAVTGAEFDLLQALCERPGLVLSRDQLLELTQGRQAAAFERSVDILISRLRRKLERDPHSPEMIKTVRSGGYLFAPQVTSP